MRDWAGLLSLALLLGACAQPTGDHGFSIRSVDLRPGYQQVHVRLQQELAFSRDAIEAIEHGVPLTVTLEAELRDAHNLSLLADLQSHFVIQYLPLSEHYRLSGPEPGDVRNYPRLRHALAALGDVELDFRTGPLAPGHYELRTRLRLDNGRMPAPMRLPALLSVRWQHDSEWSTWPFDIEA